MSSSPRCEACKRAMSRQRITGSSWVWACPKCSVQARTEATAAEVEEWRAKRRVIENRKAEKARERAQARERDEKGEAPAGEDVELWAMRMVLEHGRDWEMDVGPRQQFYRRLYDDDPFRFAKMMNEREAHVRSQTAEVEGEKDEGLERSLELAESLLAEVTRGGS